MDVVNIIASSDYEVGLLHGKARKNQIKEYLHDGLCRINYLRRKPIELKTVDGFLYGCGDIIKKQLPGIWSEIQGLKDGAEITIEEALALQLRRELSVIEEDNKYGDCTTIVKRAKEGMFIAQTIDLAGRMSDQCVVLKIENENQPGCVTYTFNGLLGYVGFNEHIAVGINMVVANNPRVGVPSYLLVREMLKKRSIEDCLSLISHITQSYSRSFTIADNNKAVFVECAGDKVASQTVENSVHTNHYILDSMQEYEKSNFVMRKNSFVRLDRANTLLKKISDTDSIMSLLADHENSPSCICVHETENLRNISTAGSVIFNINKGEMVAGCGSPCESNTRLLRIK